MTTADDWKFRAGYLRAAANRLQKTSDDLAIEAGQLRNRACDCEHEAERLMFMAKQSIAQGAE